MAATLLHTRLYIASQYIAVPTEPLTLYNLDNLNSVGYRGGEDVYLTSDIDISTNLDWLKGCTVEKDGGTGKQKTGVIILVDKGEGVVDVFYFYFWAFNYGGTILERQLGELL
ncbi:unnamed protein product [Periconia digitata]|uniref:Uncharacterized protein n=1 Tax=Periconia digitata TaxID=1303443 RepID=A0A9W4UHH4_9PLEO|nr:unnamed protein product [Periconia digitata]